MKFILVLCLIVLASVDARKQLPTTPKAGCLKNHNGTAKIADVFGPKSGPTTKLSDDGVLYSNNGRRVYESDAGTSPDGRSCKLHEKPYFQICRRLKGCDLCAAAPYCGWCEIRGECLPANHNAPSCLNSCPKDWIFNSDSCQGNTYGSFTNTAPEAEKLITPESSEPKVIVKTTKHTPGILKHHTQVGVNLKQKKVKACNSATGESQDQDIVVAEPQMGDVDYPVLVKTHHKHSVDLKTGAITDEGEQDQRKYFGIDPITGEKPQSVETEQKEEDDEKDKEEEEDESDD